MTRLPLKCLVVRAPWAGEIRAGEKMTEYRSWPTRYRGPLGIIAANRKDSGADAGRLICIVRLDDCEKLGDKDYAWRLTGPICKLEPSIPFAGRLGLIDAEIDLDCDPSDTEEWFTPAFAAK